MSELVSEPDSGQQTDDHIPAAYLGSNPTFDPEFDIGPLPSDHILSKDTGLFRSPRSTHC